jgi:hypothetical protein
MRAKWCCDKVFNLWMSLSRFGSQIWNIFFPVSARCQEIRVNDNQFGSTFHTAVECCLDRRFGDFHVSGFDDFVAGLLAEHRDHIQQQIVTLRASRAVINHDNADVRSIVFAAAHESTLGARSRKPSVAGNRKHSDMQANDQPKHDLVGQLAGFVVKCPLPNEPTGPATEELQQVERFLGNPPASFLRTSLVHSERYKTNGTDNE